MLWVGSVILMTLMTNQKKTKLTDDFDKVWTKILTDGFDQVWTKIYNFRNIFGSHFPKTALKIVFRYKNSEKGLTFSLKFPERIDVGTIKWHTPVRKYRNEFQRPCMVLKIVNNMAETKIVTIYELSVISKRDGGGEVSSKKI